MYSSNIFGVGGVSYGQPDRLGRDDRSAAVGRLHCLAGTLCLLHSFTIRAQVTTPNPGHEHTLCAATHQESMLQHFIIDHSFF